MDKQLIERLKTNLVYLAEKMPEKFELVGGSILYYRASDCSHPVVWMYPDTFMLDPQKEYSNSIGRIFKEAWKERLQTRLVAYGDTRIKMIWHSDIIDIESNELIVEYERLESTTELSAQIESLCIRCEQFRERDKK